MRLIIETLFILTSCFLLINCAPTIKIETPEPVVIDVNMSVDVHHHNHQTEETSGEADDPNSLSLDKRRLYRMAEVQNLKNDEVAGEGNNGLLHLRNKPIDPTYLEYAKTVINAENADRQELFEQQAKEEKKPLSVIIKEYVKRKQDASFPGEWVQSDDGTWKKI
ncbi:MAG: DUF1318 domain-containing protein [Verrucomicrobiota bacterium]